jgi:GT2 family glycosyltransferase
MRKREESPLSIIIPVHNSYVGKVRHCVNSIRSRTGRKLEVILVLNGMSSRQRREIAARHNDCEVVYHREALSPSAARNIGARQSDSEWLVFIDSDCKIPEDYFEVILGAISRDDAAHCYIGRLSSSGSHRLGRYEELEHTFALSRYLYHENGKTFSKVCVGANMAVRRDVFDRVGGFDELLGSAEDREFGARLYLNGYRIEYLERFCIEHEYHPSLVRAIKRHLWHASGNKMLYSQYPEVFTGPYKQRALFVLDALAKSMTGQESILYLFFSIAVIVPYIAKFSVVRVQESRQRGAFLRSKA